MVTRVATVGGFVYIIRLFLCRGVSINVLRHEAEFYGITPLGMCSWSICVYDLTLCAVTLPKQIVA